MLNLSFLHRPPLSRKRLLSKTAGIVLMCLAVLTLSSCGDFQNSGEQETSQTAANTNNAASETAPLASNSPESTPSVDNGEPSAPTASSNAGDIRTMRISVQCGGNTVVYELNDSPAAVSLYEQLPRDLEVEDFSDNEKIFYPPDELETSQTPLAEGGAGTLAYYAPWGDVVMFYGDYRQNSSLFELGHAVSGEEHIAGMTGTIRVEAVQ